MMKRTSSFSASVLIAGTAIVAVLVVGCAATELSDAGATAKAQAVMQASFKTSGIVAKERLDRDASQAQCSDYGGKDVPKSVGEAIEKRELAYIQFPADKQYMGDWRNGEALAQNGRGLQFSDPASTPRGGNCYACHQISPQELSYGTIGPTLLGFGKLRGTSEPIQQYTFGKISNAHAYKACSNMPRFGTMNILSEAQIKDLVALLLDPASPVNK